MTSKILSWATFTIVTVGALPLLASANVAPNVSSQAITPLAHAQDTLPNCGRCSTRPPILFSTTYADELYNICNTAPKLYRLWGRTNQKVLCTYGIYWFCDDSSTNTCTTLVERPPCPDNTCLRTGY
jgi:hypothetical protein